MIDAVQYLFGKSYYHHQILSSSNVPFGRAISDSFITVISSAVSPILPGLLVGNDDDCSSKLLVV